MGIAIVMFFLLGAFIEFVMEKLVKKTAKTSLLN